MTIILATGIATGCVYALVGIGFLLIYRTTGIVNFAQGVFVALGGMSAYWLLDVVQLPYPLALALALLLSVLGGLLLWALVVLPIWRRGAEPIGVMMACLVVAGRVTISLQKWLGTQPRTLPEWLPGVRIELPGGSITGQYALVIVATLVTVAGVGAFLQWSTPGRAMRACAASRETSALLGISPEAIGAISMAATAALGGLGGILIAPVGGLLVGLLQALVGRCTSAEYETVTVFVLMLVLLTFRPRGLLGSDWAGGH